MQCAPFVCCFYDFCRANDKSDAFSGGVATLKFDPVLILPVDYYLWRIWSWDRPFISAIEGQLMPYLVLLLMRILYRPPSPSINPLRLFILFRLQQWSFPRRWWDYVEFTKYFPHNTGRITILRGCLGGVAAADRFGPVDGIKMNRQEEDTRSPPEGVISANIPRLELWIRFWRERGWRRRA